MYPMKVGYRSPAVRAPVGLSTPSPVNSVAGLFQLPVFDPTPANDPRFTGFRLAAQRSLWSRLHPWLAAASVAYALYELYQARNQVGPTVICGGGGMGPFKGGGHCGQYTSTAFITPGVENVFGVYWRWHYVIDSGNPFPLNRIVTGWHEAHPSAGQSPFHAGLPTPAWPVPKPAPQERPWLNPWDLPIQQPVPNFPPLPWPVTPYRPLPEGDPAPQPRHEPRPAPAPRPDPDTRPGPQPGPQPRPQPQPEPAPQPQPGPRPRPQPQPAPRPVGRPAAPTPPGRTPEITIDRLPRVRNFRRKAPKGTEAKVAGSAAASLIWMIANFITEGKDVLESFWKALPDRYKTKQFAKNRTRSTPPVDKMWKDVERYFRSGDAIKFTEENAKYWNDVVDNLIENQIEDKVAGTAGKLLGKASNNDGRPIGYGAGPAL